MSIRDLLRRLSHGTIRYAAPCLNFGLFRKTGASIPHLLPNLLLQLFYSQLRLKHLSNTLSPRLLQHLHLPFHFILPPLALDISEINISLRIGKLLFHLLQLSLQLMIPNQPGILAVLVQQLEVLSPSREVRVGDVGVTENLLESLWGGATGGRLLCFVTGEGQRLERCF